MQKFSFFICKAAAFITERFPHRGAAFIDRIIFSTLGNPLLAKLILMKDAQSVKKIKKNDKVCVLADMNIGDAIICQAAVQELRQLSPTTQIDYVIKKSAAKLIEGNPEISNLYPIYTGAPQPKASDFRSLNKILSSSDYDLILNLCPFIPKKKLRIPKKTKVVSYLGLAAWVIKAEKNPQTKSHIIFQMHKFVYNLFNFHAPAKESFQGSRITISKHSIERAKKFINDNGFSSNRPKIFYNPDTFSRFTRIPFNLQMEILEKLTELPCEIMLGAGQNQTDLHALLLKALPDQKRNKIKIVPADIPLDVYAVLIDKCEIFITGDTGPMHVAASRKFSQFGDFKFRNKTAIFSVFGATPPRIYGYDSNLTGFFPANQDAPSRVYIAPSTYRNITCINKSALTYKTEQYFFNDLDIEKIISDAKAILNLD